MYETIIETESGVFLVNAVVDMKDKEKCFVGLLNVMKLDDEDLLFGEGGAFLDHDPTPKERNDIETKVAIKYFSEVFDE